MKKATIFIIGGIAAVAALSQLSIITIGGETYGNTALVVRTDSLRRLDFIDSDSHACRSFSGLAKRACTAGLAATVVAHPYRIKVGGYSPTIAKLAGD